MNSQIFAQKTEFFGLVRSSVKTHGLCMVRCNNDWTDGFALKRNVVSICALYENSEQSASMVLNVKKETGISVSVEFVRDASSVLRTIVLFRRGRKVKTAR